MSGAALLAAVGGDPLIEAPNLAASGNAAAPSTAKISWELDGWIDILEDATLTEEFDTWCIPSVATLAALYEIKLEQSAGDALDVGSSSLSTWLALTADQNVQITDSGGGAVAANGTYIIRRASDSLELANGTWSVDATAI